MNNLWVWFAIPSCICIGYLDYLLFSKWTKCDKCGNQLNSWYNYLIPTFIEISLFLSGIAIGVLIK
jgi:hypothetical protein